MTHLVGSYQGKQEHAPAQDDYPLHSLRGSRT